MNPSRNGGPAIAPLETRAFGMDIGADFPMPGVVPARHEGDGRSLSLRLGSDAEVASGFPEHADRIGELRFDDGRVAVSVDCAGSQGYGCYAFDFGRALVSADGRRVVIAPLEKPPWVWQRYLTGQILPLSAVLQGLEVFHASVLGHEGGAFAIVAHSGVGKTTLALRLALRGLAFLSDDVLVLEQSDGALIAHPGVGLANLRPGAGDLLRQLQGAGLAAPIGASEDETRIAISRSNDPLPLRALFLFSRFGDPRGLEIERLSPVDPRLLLAATYNFSIRTRERLTRQLDTCARIERCSDVFQVRCGADVSADRVAEAIAQHADDLMATPH